ncbi:hypothetical protein FACS189472_16790 [Alphaproteobacteria bacterium]|nr:hypothetical protein FACS189472_16790 [Alphaproteobacteria bacterium]
MQNYAAKFLALNEVGTVNSILQKFDPKLGIQEGIGKYSYLSVESTSPKPYVGNCEIVIKLTDPNVDIVEFHRSFFVLEMDIDGIMQTKNTTIDCPNTDIIMNEPPAWSVLTLLPYWLPLVKKSDLFFIGLKNSTDIIESYKIQHNGIDIGSTMQNNATLESFLYNQCKGHTEKDNNSGSYSLYENVIKGDESVCGRYLKYSEIEDQQGRVHIKFYPVIQFNMLL